MLDQKIGNMFAVDDLSEELYMSKLQTLVSMLEAEVTSNLSDEAIFAQ